MAFIAAPVLLCGGVAAILMLKDGDEKASPPPPPPPLHGEYRFHSLGGPVWDRVGVAPLKEASEGCCHHYALTYEQGILTTIDELKPQRFLVARSSLVHEEGRLKNIRETDSYGNLVAITTFEGDAYRRTLRSGKLDLNGCLSHRFAWDAGTRTAKTTCLNAQGKPSFDASGQAAFDDKYDSNNLHTNRRLTRHDGRPANNLKGIGLISYTYDGEGRLRATAHKDATGTLVTSPDDGCAELHHERHPSGLIRLTTCISTSGAPVKNHQGSVSTAFEYDDRGCRIKAVHLDKNGQPMTGPSGVGTTLKSRNDHCDALSVRTLNAQGQPTAIPGEKKVFEVRLEYDKKGQNIWAGCFDRVGKPARMLGCREHARSTKYDDKGRAVERVFLDVKGKAMNCRYRAAGWATNRIEYDENGLPTRETSLSATGKLRLSWHTTEYARNADRYVIEKHTLGRGEHLTVYDRNDFNQIRSISYLDPRRQPLNLNIDVMDIDDPKGRYHRVELVFGESGKHVKDVYYNTRGRRLLTVDCSRGRCWAVY